MNSDVCIAIRNSCSVSWYTLRNVSLSAPFRHREGEALWLSLRLTLILLTWRIWWAANNVSRWQMVFNSAYKEL